MKVIFTLIIPLFLIQVATARQISFEIHPDHQAHDMQTFPVNNTRLTVGDGQILFGETLITQPLYWAVSPSGRSIASIDGRGDFGLRVSDSRSYKILHNPLEFFRPDDQTLALYLFDDARSIVRDNVANFSFLSADGTILYSVSNSSGSPEGERESQLASDRTGTTVVLYNPLILRANGNGSRAAILRGEENRILFYESLSDEIKGVEISDNGSFVTLVTSGSEGDTVLLFDRFGNELFSVTSSDPLSGASLTDDGSYVTLFTSGRMQVYHTESGELLGSASSRSRIIRAVYSPEEQLILALGGTVRGRSITGPTLTAVHTGLRRISREEIPYSLSLLHPGRVEITSEGRGRFVLTGLNRQIKAEISF